MPTIILELFQCSLKKYENKTIHLTIIKLFLEYDGTDDRSIYFIRKDSFF